jgi:hypothetical protein
VDRGELLTRLEKAWGIFQESYTGLSDLQLTGPGVAGEWSVRDIVTHVTIWEQEALKHLPTILKGERPPRYSTTHGGINAFNRTMTEQNRSLTLAEVQRQAADTHRRLLSFLESVPEDQFSSETPFRQRLRLDTYSHYRKHADAIRKWRANLEKNHDLGSKKADSRGEPGRPRRSP